MGEDSTVEFYGSQGGQRYPMAFKFLVGIFAVTVFVGGIVGE